MKKYAVSIIVVIVLVIAGLFLPRLVEAITTLSCVDDIVEGTSVSLCTGELDTAECNARLAEEKTEAYKRAVEKCS